MNTIPPSSGSAGGVAVAVCTCFRARKFARLLSQRYDRALAPVGATVNQYSILRHAGRGDYSISELARQLGMDRSTLSRELKPMCRTGWLELAIGTDARERLVRITAEGRKLVAQSMPLWRRAQEEIQAMVGARELERLHRRIDSALDRLARADLP